MFENLKGYDVVLGSKSPRRKELLAMLGIDFRTIAIKDINEEYPENMPAEEVPEYLSVKKAEAYIADMRSDTMIITADTLVICDGRIMGKPHDADDSIGMLEFLSGREHKVITGVTVATRDRKESFSSVTKVRFANVSREEAKYYVEVYKPFDKAGAYGIQEWIGCVAVESIDGSYYNVMGLPVHQLYRILKKF